MVHFFRSALTAKQLKELIFTNPEKADDNKLFEEIHKTIRESKLYMDQCEKGQTNIVYACLILDSFFNPKDKKIYLATALGAGAVAPRLGIFGSHLTHSWPEDENELINRFTDDRKLDLNQLGYDASDSKVSALNTGLGAMLHEVGHGHTLGHSGEGIMERDWWFNRFFCSIEKQGDKFVAVRNILDEKKTGWKKEDAVILANHPNIKYSLTQDKEKTMVRDPAYSLWQTNDGNNSFIAGKYDWIERHGGKNAFFFKLVEQDGDTVIIHDPSRNIYVSLDSNSFKWGSSKDNIVNLLGNGSWVNELGPVKHIISNNSHKIWKAKDSENYFKCENNEWVETQNGQIAYRFQFVEDKKDSVILYANDRNFFISLDSQHAKWGDSKDDIANIFNFGGWIN